MVAIYGMDSPYSQPEMVGYDAFGRPVYNRNARQKALGIAGDASGGFGLGGPSMMETSYQTGGVNPFSALGSAAQLAKNARNAWEEGAPTQYGYGTEAGGLLNPTSYGSFGPNPAGYTGPAFNSEWAAADAIDAGANGAWAAGDAIDAGSGAASAADAGGSMFGAAGEALPYVGAALSLYDMFSNGFSGKNGLGLASSVMPMIGMAGGPGVAAMTALIALGGGFDPDTARMGLNTRVPIGAGGLGSANWNQADTAIGNAPGAWSSRAAELYDALNQRIASGNVDPSWLNPDANVFIEYGADADMGFENPQAAIIFDSGLRSDPWYGADGMAGGNEPVGRVTWMPQPTGRGGAGSFDALMQMIRTAPLPMFSPAGQYQLPAELVPTLYGMSAQEIYEREMSALQDLQKA
jgi:hypothetical protein